MVYEAYDERAGKTIAYKEAKADDSGSFEKAALQLHKVRQAVLVLFLDRCMLPLAIFCHTFVGVRVMLVNT